MCIPGPEISYSVLYTVHSSPKETQLFWSCQSFGEECRSVISGPNVISTMLLTTICQKPHSKIPHRSHTVIRHLSASHPWNFTKMDASRQFESCLSFLEECMAENLEQYNISTYPPGNNMQKTPLKNPHGCLAILKWLSTCHLRKIFKLTKSSNLLRHGLRILVTILEPVDIF